MEEIQKLADFARISIDILKPLPSHIPSLAVFAFANEERTVRVDVIRSTNSFAFLMALSFPYQTAYSAFAHF